LQPHEGVKGEWRPIEVLQSFVDAAHAGTAASGQYQSCDAEIVHK
jgi:hypothetical protein